MVKRLLWALLVLGYSFNGYADAGTDITLTPQEGFHKFPFFEIKTPVWNYNNRIPGPVIRAKEGTVLNIDVENRLTEPTSVHWHGLRIDNALKINLHSVQMF